MRGTDGKYIKDWRAKQQKRAAWINRGRRSPECYHERHGECDRVGNMCHCECHGKA